jgi:hypothetical protein
MQQRLGNLLAHEACRLQKNYFFIVVVEVVVDDDESAGAIGVAGVTVVVVSVVVCGFLLQAESPNAMVAAKNTSAVFISVLL